jgi:primosomal protein N' (replication factor Y)
MHRIVNVLLPTPFDTPFSYAVNDDMPVPEVGQYATVPFRNKELHGVVWEIPTQPPTFKGVLKHITKVHPFAPLSHTTREFIAWAANYSLTPMGSILKLALSVPQVFLPIKGKTLTLPNPDITHAPATLSTAQETACETIKTALDTHSFSPLVLDGVTGSGKTEVYFEAVAHALSHGKQVLILLPEIALSAQMMTRFAKRFGCAPCLWHSGLTPAVRRETWKAIVDGTAKVVVGARSALFLPYKNLGLLIVDEEHDASYKQEEGVIYNARNMAVMRAKFESIPVVLVSATPSLETVCNLEARKYTALTLPERHGEAVFCDVQLIDMRKHKPPKGQWIAEPLKKAVLETLSRGEQALLFLNKRGYAPLTLCQACGHRWQCPQCSACLVVHKSAHKLVCHHCGYHEPEPEHCPKCAAEDSITPCGPGIERLAEEAATTFPEAHTALLSSDSMASHEAAENLIGKVMRDEVNLLIGTQIIAKGYHFPNLTLVGVIDADIGLSGGDLRAAEKTWQLLHQVAGRAGREAKKGTVYLQTFLPEHPVMQTLQQHQRDAFVQQQIHERHFAQLPPFGKLASVIIAADTLTEVQKAAQLLARAVPIIEGLTILGPAPAPLALLKGYHRIRFLVKTPRVFPLQKTLREWLEKAGLPRTVKVQVDIDPYSFL